MLNRCQCCTLCRQCKFRMMLKNVAEKKDIKEATFESIRAHCGHLHS